MKTRSLAPILLAAGLATALLQATPSLAASPPDPVAAKTAPPPARPLALPLRFAARPSSPPAPSAMSAPAQSPRPKIARYARSRASTPLAQLSRANREARDGPASGAFVNSTLYHPYEPGRIYDLHTRPLFLTTITLRPGEKLISKAAGDTVRWVLGETEAGAGEALQVIILVKPTRPNLRTNIVLTTDQRTYLIDAVSSAAGPYTSVLAWTYPQEEARARTAAAASAASPQAQVLTPAVPVERLDFGYAVRTTKGRPPPWQPVRVFNDGAKTYVEFPPDLAVREAPPLFLLDDDDQVQLVIPRLAGRYLVVDRLIERAELRLGDKKPVVVRITRRGARS
ncbi:TrbG/VirB9 family P-type conjugative transfer protein [Caulobacter sp.]|uniref:TrbG/VirB9 family P-type conjugative transfer protein n=1 Tax=Caulobacter sp. TaxID=78 RepID=UPI0025C3724F|nr:TrbG/VirB9 family P-type conjugative transfer protein [Caulobacter sp.]